MESDNPFGVPLARALLMEDTCPKCLGELDIGWECNRCGYDAMRDAELYARQPKDKEKHGRNP